jgi:hypothetical protein
MYLPNISVFLPPFSPSFSFQYEASREVLLKPCKEYASQYLEVNNVMALLKIRAMLSILALIA